MLATEPTDPPYTTLSDYSSNWGLASINAAHAYRRGYFGEGVRVAVVDTGVDTGHADLAPNILEGLRINRNGRDGTLVVDLGGNGEGHGTGVAGVVAAVSGNDGAHGVAPRAKIIPYQAKTEGTGDSLQGDVDIAFDDALDRDVQIINNSFGPTADNMIWDGKWKAAGGQEYDITAEFPYVYALITHNDYIQSRNDEIKDRFQGWADIMRDEDAVMVWSAGNDRWNSEFDEASFSCERGGQACRTALQPICTSLTDCRTTHADFINRFILTDTQLTNSAIEFADLGITTLDSPNTNAHAPHFQDSLLGKWVVVTGATEDKKIHYNGCGEAKYWCMVAPGYGIRVAQNKNNTVLITRNGTSYAAPFVSGALAVLKSRLPDMPMRVVLGILFDTAEDLGANGIDDVYGRGFLDLGAAIRKQGEVMLVFEGSGSGNSGNSALVESSEINLSPALRGLSQASSSVSVAVRYLDDYYYNMPLASLIEESESQDMELGRITSTMLDDQQQPRGGLGFSSTLDSDDGTLRSASYAREDWSLQFESCDSCTAASWQDNLSAAPFFALDEASLSGRVKLRDNLWAFARVGLDDTSYSQAGLSLQSDVLPDRLWNLRLDIAQISERDGFLGSQFVDGLALGDTHAYQTQLHGDMKLGSSGWKLIAGGTLGLAAADGTDSSMIAQISELSFSGWQLGLRGTSLAKQQDSLWIQVVRETAVDKGKLHLRHGLVTEEPQFDEYLYMNANRTFDTVTSSIELEQEAATAIQLGYSLPLSANMRAAFSIEHAYSDEIEDDFAVGFALSWKQR